jgi:hypothetical protein
VVDDSGDSRYRGRSDASLLCDADVDPSAFSELYTRHVGAVYGAGTDGVGRERPVEQLEVSRGWCFVCGGG